MERACTHYRLTQALTYIPVAHLHWQVLRSRMGMTKEQPHVTRAATISTQSLPLQQLHEPGQVQLLAPAVTRSLSRLRLELLWLYCRLKTEVVWGQLGERMSLVVGLLQRAEPLR